MLIYRLISVVSHLTIYRSSAGSGKTRTLAKVYLALALRFRADYFRHILAVTFTNKATQEMKNRIVKYLDEFSRGITNDLTSEMQESLDLDQHSFSARSQEVLQLILHHYSDFSISTIDAFFQRVIRAFTREAGLAGDYRLIVDNNEVLDEVVVELLDEAGHNEQLTRWLVEFTLHALENEQKLDIRADLKKFAGLLLKEEFKLVENKLATLDSEKLKTVREELNEIRFRFLNTIKGFAAEAVQWFEENGLEVNDFKHGKSGSVFGWFKKIAGLKSISDISEDKVGEKARKNFHSASEWPAPRTAKKEIIQQFAESKGIALLQNILRFRDKHYAEAVTAEVILKNLYLFGLTQDLIRKLREYRDQHRAMLLDEASSFLQNIISESETPFIYEKVGSFYRHFLIDEFQDTSGLQWNNLRPLVIDSLDQGNECMVVGDVKQAIYRWRGGDLKLLHEELEKQVGKNRVKIEPLDTNYRSALQIVTFNNAFFKTASQIVGNLTGAPVPVKAFEDVVQQQHRHDEGCVQIELIPSKSNSSEWKEVAKEKLCAIIEDLQQKGVPPRDIAILVRTNKEGQDIITHLVNYQYSGKAKSGVRYEVVSNDSLRIDNAATVNLLLHAMRYLYNPDDHVARAGLLFEYNRIHFGQSSIHAMQITHEKEFRKNLPESFVRREAFLRGLPIYELTETLIGIFNLTGQQGEIAYMQAFQDLVLNFANREQNELGAFLDWWDEVCNTEKATIKSASESNAIQLLTIHKSKGLQFKYVIIPYCSWKMDQSGDHILWVQTNIKPFDVLGALPVWYSRQLQDSYFNKDYEDERISSYLDNLNVMYVAFTRAEKGLFVIAPCPENSKDINDVKVNSVDKLLVSVLRQNYGSEYGDKMAWGTLPDTVPEPVKAIDHSLPTYATYSWRQRLVVRSAAQSEAAPLREAGIRLHDILSRLHYADELPDRMEHLVNQGVLSQQEADQLQQQVTRWFGQSVVASWFDRSWKVRTEVPVLTPDGAYRRIDRLLLQKNRAVVIDFKTGNPKPGYDDAQVREYMHLLLQMGMDQVSGYVFYTQSGKYEEVRLTSSGRKKKGNNNQLTLDF